MSASPLGAPEGHPRFSQERLLRAIASTRRACAPNPVHYQLASWTSDVAVPVVGYPIELPVWMVTCQHLGFAAVAGGVIAPTTWIFDARSGKMLGIFSFRAASGSA